jgi:hypothetical protein
VEGIFLDLKSRALHPLGNFSSQVIKKCLHLKQVIFFSFIFLPMNIQFIIQEEEGAGMDEKVIIYGKAG